MGIIEALISVPHREVAGSTASSRFRYQQNWALSRLIAAHRTGDDYSFAFEFHDDVLHLDSSTLPKRVCFCQVKTKESGRWSLRALISRGRDGDIENHSILDKLYKNRDQFRGLNAEFIFATNCYFNFFERGGELKAFELGDSDLQKLTESLREKFSGFKESDLHDIAFQVSGLSLSKHDEVVLAEIINLFREVFGEEHASEALIWHRAIKEEIRLKNDLPANEVQSAADFISQKCITRKGIEETLNEIKASTATKLNWPTVRTFLINDGISMREITPIEQAWNRFAIQKLNYADQHIQKLIEDAYRCIKAVSPESRSNSVVFLNEAFSKYLELPKDYITSFPDGFVKAAIMWVVYESGTL